jgi:DNA-binding SARP family transcriptional activator
MPYFRVLGPLRIEDGRCSRAPSATLPVAGRRQQIILSILIVNLGQYVSIGRLVEGVWSGYAPPATCRKQVQNATASLRRFIQASRSTSDGATLSTGPRGYCLQARRDAIDAMAFEDVVRGAVRNRLRGLADPDIVGTLRVALQLWAGEPFAELDATELRSEAARLQELRLLAIEELADLELRLGGEPAIHVAQLSALTQRHPMRERLWLLLMEALDQCGRTAEALDRFRRYRAMLIDQHAIEPGPLIRAKERQLLQRA